jgi:uncharacterized protein (TIGR02246 family)
MYLLLTCCCIHASLPHTVIIQFPYFNLLLYLPTNIFAQVRTCRQGIIDYFQTFLKLRPFGTINNSVVREVGPGIAINSGVYTFKLTRPETGVTDSVRARYTFIYKKINDQWYIAEHHSSAMPEPITA